MAKKIIKKKGMSAKQVVGIGAGVAVLSAAAYILFGPNGKKNRKVIRGWTVKMKGEIIEEFEKTKDLTEAVYNNIIDKAQARYAKFNNVDKGELTDLVQDIKKHWKVIKKEVDSKSKKLVKTKK